MDISGKVAIVTGGAPGLGLATVLKLASEGATAVILDLPSSEGKKVAEEMAPR
jgi:NAD(P)-dependent dehydrogenase (short-subunit alcohol dehydrogenase family)